METKAMSTGMQPHDALLLVDVQGDFLPGGALGVPEGDRVVPVLNRYIALARKKQIPVFASRDWHPANHCSFKHRGGPWPPHCIAGTEGAQITPALELPADAVLVDKGTSEEADAYSAFNGTTLAGELRARGVKRILVGGLATDYCVLNTVRDALKESFEVVLLTDAIRAVDVNAGDGVRAEAEMLERGAQPAVYAEIDA
jgi:nicotinamidase/pyrazinamidase